MPLDIQDMLTNFNEVRDEATLRRLLRKMEITGKLYRTYNDALSAPETNLPAEEKMIHSLMLCILDLAEKKSDIRLINGALKIADGRMTLPEYIPNNDILTRIEKILQAISLR